MKRLLFLAAALFSAFSASADCAGTGLSAFPADGMIYQNSIFLIEGYAESQSVVYGLNTRYPVYLKNGDQKIRLNVKETLIGQFWVSQALLVPESELEAGIEYMLCIDSLPEYEQFSNFDYETRELVPYTYFVAEGNDTEKPMVSAIPKETGKNYTSYGCGPSVNVNFDLTATDASPMLAKTTVKSLLSGEETTYYLVVRGAEIIVGHGMCAGAFTFPEQAGDNYEVEFSFMDASGNMQAWEGPRIQFTRPKSTDQLKINH